MGQKSLPVSKSVRVKGSYKRPMMVGIFAVGLACVMFTGQPTGSRAATNDIPDVNPNANRNYLTLTETSTESSMSSVSLSSSIAPDFDGSTESVVVVAPVLSGNCTPPTINDFPPDLFTAEERKQGALVIHFLASIYIFYAIALVCDDFFVPAIESICQALRLPSDVAGATFMAIATSAPELYTNLIGTFVTEGDLGVGTVVGSAVFNLLAVCALCGLAAKQPIHLDWWSLTRDCGFYSLAVVFLLAVLSNRKVFWYEALVLVLLYFLYIIVMYYNAQCRSWAERLICGPGSRPGSAKEKRRESKSFLEQSLGRESEKAPLIGEKEGKSSYTYEGESSPSEDMLPVETDEMLIAKALQQTEAHARDEEEEWGLFSIPWGQGWLKWVEWTVGWPARFVLVFTIPDCREHRFRKWYPLTFIMCIIWIALLTYAMAWMMTVIGSTLNIPDTVMGLTFIAAGTSIPEAVSSVIVTRQGLGSMGISNSIGSNTFDILICLGVPWLIRASMIAPSHIAIISGGLEYSTILLIASVIVLYFLLACNRFVLNTRIGIIALLMYAAFLVISSLFELNVFFQVNLPTCTS